MTTKKTEGIILQTIKFQEYDQIATVYTPFLGIIKLFVKGAYQNKNHKGALTAPLSRAEFVYAQSKSGLYSCREISMLNQHLNLRQNLTLLETASELIKIIHDSQWEHAPAPDLYQLLVSYLEKIPVIPNPRLLVSSFKLKLLRYEGLVSLNPENMPSHILEIPFSAEEMNLIYLLTFARRFKDLCLAEIHLELEEKINRLYSDLIFF